MRKWERGTETHKEGDEEIKTETANKETEEGRKMMQKRKGEGNALGRKRTTEGTGHRGEKGRLCDRCLGAEEGKKSH